MKKLTLSAIGGFLFGWLTTVLFMDYKAHKTSHVFITGNGTKTEMSDGSTIVEESPAKVVRELDFDFVFSVLVLSVGGAIVIYLIWSYIEKKRHEEFLEEFHNRKRKEN